MNGTEEPEIVIGTVTAPFGIKGEVKVRVETDFPERFLELSEVWLKPRTGTSRMTQVESVRFHQSDVLIKFEGCNDRNCAEGLRGAELRIERSQLKELESDQFYIHDILGLDVYTTDGRHLGQVTEVLKSPANDVYVTPKAMIPATRQVVREIDLESRRITVEQLDDILMTEA